MVSLEDTAKDQVAKFRASHPKGTVWTPRKHESPRSSIWSLQLSSKIWPHGAVPDKQPWQPYAPPPPPPPLKRAVEAKKVYVKEEELLEAAQAHLQEAERLESTRPSPTLQVQLGQILLSKDDYIKKILKDWDRGKGEFLKAETRLNLRSIGLVVSSQQADELFDSWDDDRGGSLDMKELKRALQTAANAARAFQNAPDKCGEQARIRRQRAELAQEAAKATSKATDLEKAHLRHVNGLAYNADIQLGALLYKRQIRPATMVAQWSKPSGKHAGELSKHDFVDFCISLGLPECITPQEIVSVFDNFDEDKGGFMDVHEAKSMLRGLLDKAEAEEKVGRSMERQAHQMRAKATKLAQAALEPLGLVDENELPDGSTSPAAARPCKGSKGKAKGKGKKSDADKNAELIAALQEVYKVPFDDETVELLTRVAHRIGRLQSVRAFNRWQGFVGARREALGMVSAVVRRWHQQELVASLSKWHEYHELRVRIRLGQACSWSHYSKRRHLDVLKQWREARNRRHERRRLGLLVQTGIRRTGMHPEPRRLLKMVLHAWLQLHLRQRAAVRGGIFALFARLRLCLMTSTGQAQLEVQSSTTPAAAIVNCDSSAEAPSTQVTADQMADTAPTEPPAPLQEHDATGTSTDAHIDSNVGA